MMVHLVLELFFEVDVLEDDAGAHGTVEGGMEVAAHPHEVRRAVVELVAVEMVADVVSGRWSPESGTDESVNVSRFVEVYERIDGSVPMPLIARSKPDSQLVSFAVDDVAFFVGEVGFATDE